MSSEFDKSMHNRGSGSAEELHRRLVETGMFDTIPTKDFYGPDELVVTRDSHILHKIDDNGNSTVQIWRIEDEILAPMTISREDVRGIQGYVKLMYEVEFPILEVEADDYGHVEVKWQGSKD